MFCHDAGLHGWGVSSECLDCGVDTPLLSIVMRAHWRRSGRARQGWLPYALFRSEKSARRGMFGSDVPLSQGQVSAEGILHLVNPNSTPNSGMRIFEPRILGPNSGVEFFGPMFSNKKSPPQKFTPKKFTAQNSHQKIHPRIRAEKFTLHFCRVILLTLSEKRQKPQPPLLLKRVLQYTSNLYFSTPPICIAVLLVPLSSHERAILQYSSDLYRSTPPICIAVLLGKSWWLWSLGCSPPQTGENARFENRHPRAETRVLKR